MHNLKGYGGHLIIKHAYKIMQNLDNNTNISAMPTSYEKFMHIKHRQRKIYRLNAAHEVIRGEFN